MSHRGIRTATHEDLPAVMNVLDGSYLAIDADTVRSRIATDEVLVYADGDTVIGALVLDGDHVQSLAVRRSRRLQGIGAALVEAADDRCDGRLTADFRDEIRPFYESLGFDVRAADGRAGHRYHGVR